MMPAAFAERLGRWVADRIASQSGSTLVEAVRSNQAVARGLPLEHPAAAAAVREVLQTITRSYIVMFRLMRRGQAGLRQAGELDPQLIAAGREIIQAGRGLIYAGAHTAGLDLLLLMIGNLGFPILALAYPETEASYTVTNRIRRSFGVNLAPTDFRSLRQAIRHLRNGGIVVTAVDRPDPNGELIGFFGHPARLLVGHARLALRTRTPIMIGGTYLADGGRYRGVLLEVIDSEDYPDSPEGALRLAQAVMSVHEQFIRKRPGEWLMLHPVWPQYGRPRPVANQANARPG
jgi:KDO2-lipid IV(A) lauroyltransferase